MSERIDRIVRVALDKASRSTTPEGERKVDLANALRLIEKHGLDPDDFDIPGRERTRKPPPSRFRSDLFEMARAPQSYTSEDVSDAIRRFREGMATAQAAEAAKAQRERESYMSEAFDFLKGRGPRSSSARAADFLNANGVPCYRSGDAWAIILDGELFDISEREVVRIAERRGFKP